MRKLLALLLVLMLPCLSLAEATPTDLPHTATLTVSGTATVRLKADQARLSLGVVRSAATVDAAMEEGSMAVRTVFAALKAAGVAEEDMVNEDYAVTLLYTYDHGKLAEKETVSGYQVENTLRVIVRDVAQLGNILNAVTQAGANECYSITFASTQSQAASDEALSRAIAEGARKAELAAMAAGCRLGALVSIVEQPGTYAGVHFAADSDTAILPEGLQFTATVTMVYEME